MRRCRWHVLASEHVSLQEDVEDPMAKLTEAKHLIERVVAGVNPRRAMSSVRPTREASGDEPNYEDGKIDGVDLTVLYDMLEGDLTDKIDDLTEKLKKEHGQLQKIHSYKSSDLSSLISQVAEAAKHLDEATRSLMKASSSLDKYYRDLNDMDD